MFRPAYPLETERLTIRPFARDDLHALHAFLSREDVARYHYWDARDRAEVAEIIAGRAGLTVLEHEGDRLALAVVERSSQTLIGEVFLIWNSEQHSCGEIGYSFNPDWHGHGYATEAARELLRLGFDEFGLHRIIGRLDGRNKASARVLERLGMRKEGHLVQNEFVKGEWADEIDYAMLRTEWLSAR